MEERVPEEGWMRNHGLDPGTGPGHSMFIPAKSPYSIFSRPASAHGELPLEPWTCAGTCGSLHSPRAVHAWLRVASPPGSSPPRPDLPGRSAERDIHRPASSRMRDFAAAGFALRCAPSEAWWAVQDLNLQHPACKAGALPIELTARIVVGREDGRRARACQSCGSRPRKKAARNRSDGRAAGETVHVRQSCFFPSALTVISARSTVQSPPGATAAGS